MRSTLNETSSNEGTSNGNLRRRVPTPVSAMTTELHQLRLQKRSHNDNIHVINEEEVIKREIKLELMNAPKRQREDSGIDSIDDDDITVIGDFTNIYTATKRMYSYAGLFGGGNVNSGGLLKGKCIRDFANDQYESARKPLGCAFDESTKEWFLADSANDAIRILRKDSTLGTAIYCKLHYPSAVVITEPGRECAVLDHRGIHLYDYRREAMTTLVRHDIKRDGYFNCRGLALTSEGDLVTISLKSVPEIRFYSTKKQNELIKAVPYKMMDNSRIQEACPSFIDIAPCGSKDKMVVTDLGTGTFLLYSLNPKTRELTLEKQVDCKGYGDDKFQFISGAKFDANCELLIADARGHSLKYLSRDGKFVQKFEFDDAFPYVSNFCVNSNNELFVCDRRDGRMKLYKITAKDNVDRYLDGLVN